MGTASREENASKKGRSGRGDQAIADAAHRLQEQRIGRIALDLAPEAIDLHVDRALVHGVAAGQGRAWYSIARRYRQDAQHLAFAVGEMNGFLALAQFAAFEMEHVRPERDLLQH